MTGVEGCCGAMVGVGILWLTERDTASTPLRARLTNLAERQLGLYRNEDRYDFQPHGEHEASPPPAS